VQSTFRNYRFKAGAGPIFLANTACRSILYRFRIRPVTAKHAAARLEPLIRSKTMSLMKWFRRNNRKILAIAVVGLMFVFVGGSALRMACSYTGPRTGKAVALFGKNNKITLADTRQANSELAVLRQIRADTWLRSLDIHGVLLSELLFSESRITPMIISSLRQAIRTNQLRISDEQIFNMSKKTESDEIYWHLLKKEAESAGIAFSSETAAGSLQQFIPKLFNGESYAQVINTFINQGISEETVQSTFAKLLAVLRYASIACSNEELTRTQISQLVSDELQTMNTQFVKVSAELFTDEQAEPNESRTQEQFDKYKAYYPGEVSQDNPYGFGYKLDNRVQLEYIIIKLDDIKNIIEKPTQQEKELYYLTHASEFTAQRPSDPNDPNSPPIQYTMSYGQVAGLITSRMTSDRIIKKMEEILGRAKQLAEEKYGDSDAAELTDEQLKQLAVDFGGIAEKLAKQYSVNIYSGKTGLLSVLEVKQDENLSGMFLKPAGSGRMPHSLTELIFSVDQLDSAEQTLGDIPNLKIYETIGPLIDIWAKTAALVRVVDAKKAAVPARLDVSFSSAKVKLDQPDTAANNDVYSVREQVVKDLKRLSAMQTAKEKAGQFLPLAQKDGWEKAVEQFNQQYPPAGPNEPNNFELTIWTDLKKPSPDLEEILDVQSKGIPGAHLVIDAHNRSKMIIDALSSLVPNDSNSPKELPTLLEVRPDLSYYCIESLSVNRINRNEYDTSKTLLAFKQNALEDQSLGAVYFQPENILRRMNFRRIKEPQRQAEPNEPAAQTAGPPQES
jgi:hypothetical protein